MAFTHIDCFSGPGGICTGMHVAGFDQKLPLNILRAVLTHTRRIIQKFM